MGFLLGAGRIKPFHVQGVLKPFPRIIRAAFHDRNRQLKNAICGVALHPSSLRRTLCTPHSSGFARLASHRFAPACTTRLFQRAGKETRFFQPRNATRISPFRKSRRRVPIAWDRSRSPGFVKRRSGESLYLPSVLFGFVTLTPQESFHLPHRHTIIELVQKTLIARKSEGHPIDGYPVLAKPMRQISRERSFGVWTPFFRFRTVGEV